MLPLSGILHFTLALCHYFFEKTYIEQQNILAIFLLNYSPGKLYAWSELILESRSNCDASRLVDSQTTCSEFLEFKRSITKRHENVTAYSWVILVQRCSCSLCWDAFHAYFHNRVIYCYQFESYAEHRGCIFLAHVIQVTQPSWIVFNILFSKFSRVNVKFLHPIRFEIKIFLLLNFNNHRRYIWRTTWINTLLMCSKYRPTISSNNHKINLLPHFIPKRCHSTLGGQFVV